MSAKDPTDQVKFLVSCIGHTSNGRPDFGAVATELGIVSKAAAQKRYERMLKANGVNGKGAANKDKDNGETTSPTKSSPTKRKAATANGDNKPKKTVKRVGKKEEEIDGGCQQPQTPVKGEESDSVLSDSAFFDRGDEF